MAARRNKYKSDFKAQVALEALTGEKTTQELAQIYKIHPAMITAWKRQLIKGSASIFDKTHEKDDANVDVELLYKKIGQLEVEKDFLATRQGVISHLTKAPDDRSAGQATHCKTM